MMIKKQEFAASFYNEVYSAGGHNKEYFKHPDDSVYFPVWKKLLSYLTTDDTIADFGCGPGQLAELLIRKEFNYVMGIDFSTTAIAMAKKNNFMHRNKFFVRDLNTDPLYGNFNTAIICEVLEHLENDCQLLAKFIQGTKIIATVPDFDSKSHVRLFKTEDDIIKRYSFLLEIKKIVKVPLRSGNSIFIINSIKK